MADVNLITEARALLMQFERSSLKAMRVATADLDVACSRDPGIRIASLSHGTTNHLDASELALTAPHIGTLASILPVGSAIVAGQPYAALSLLDEEIDLIAGEAGTIGRHDADPGALVEYGAAIATLVH